MLSDASSRLTVAVVVSTLGSVSTPIPPLPQNTYASFEPAPPAPVEINPDNPPWAIPGAVALWFVSVLLIMFVPLIFFLPYAAQQQVPLEQMGQFAQTDKTAIFLQVLATIPAHLLTFGLAWALVTRFGKLPFLRTLGWEWDARFNFWKSAGLAVALLLAGMLIIWRTGNPETPLDKMIQSSRATAVTTAFLATFTAPLVEEIVYRGVLYPALQRTVGVVWAVLLVLALFAIIHVPQYHTSAGVIAAILMLSAVLTFVRAYTGKLLPCFIIHLVFNGIQSILIVAGPYLERFTPEKTEAPGFFLMLANTMGQFITL